MATINPKTLPEGWTVTDAGQDRKILRAPGGRGAITVDLHDRIFSPGSFTRCTSPKKTYGGKGWLLELLADAIAEHDLTWES